MAWTLAPPDSTTSVRAGLESLSRAVVNPQNTKPDAKVCLPVSPPRRAGLRTTASPCQPRGARPYLGAPAPRLGGPATSSDQSQNGPSRSAPTCIQVDFVFLRLQCHGSQIAGPGPSLRPSRAPSGTPACLQLPGPFLPDSRSEVLGAYPASPDSQGRGKGPTPGRVPLHRGAAAARWRCCLHEGPAGPRTHLVHFPRQNRSPL